MSEVLPHPDEVFNAARRLAEPHARRAYLDRACSDAPELRRRVEALLRAHEEAGNFLESPALGLPENLLAAGGDALESEGPGKVVGPYRLLEQIGEGGMGMVYLAEQTRPVRRQVALKVIKAGMDTRQVVARFESERQALAMMDHPTIARVLDAGATDSGRPYFVMELVNGVPITEFCDVNRFPPRQRLELFVQVCQAVQHAHTKGIIHRDLKPSNVLVTMQDERAVPKVIDFGIAKATEARLTERTLFTEVKQFVGTPQYTSPEQAQMSGLDVDTRSDIYSLGVLLYELLTGTTPLDPKELRVAGLGEMQRLIRETEPPKPSTRLSTMGQSLSVVAAHRSAEPRRLPRLVRGELDWVVMKCLEKDRTRRYQTASGLAGDVQRYLNNEPVLACPPSAGYRLRKWARRNKGPFSVGAGLALLAVVGVVFLAVSNARIRREQGRTLAEKGRAEAAQRLAEDRAAQIRLGLDRLKAANVLLDRGRWYASQNRWDDADAAFTGAIDLRPDHASVWAARGDLYAHLGLFDLAAKDVLHEVELSDPDNATRWLQHALLRLEAGDVEGCRRAAARMRERFGGTINYKMMRDLVRVCLLTPATPDDDGAAEARRLVAVSERLLEDDPSSPYSMLVLGTARLRAGAIEPAAEALRRSITKSDWEPRLMGWPTLAMALHRQGRTEEAGEALAQAAAALDRWNPVRRRSEREWIHDYDAAASWPVPWWDWVDCHVRYREACQLIKGSPPADDPSLRLLRARAFAGLRRSEQAVAEYEAAVALNPQDKRISLEAHRARGLGHAMNARWVEAADEYAKATALLGDDINLWRFRAIAQFAAGDDAAYRQTCAAILERFGRTTDLHPMTACRIVEVCVLSGSAQADPRIIRPLVDVAARQWHYGAWVRGAVLYRTGAYGEAVACLSRMAQVHKLRAWDWCFLSMAHHRLGQGEEARQCLDEARRWIREADRRQSDDPTGAAPAWGDWTEQPKYRLLLREAEALVEGETRPKGGR